MNNKGRETLRTLAARVLKHLPNRLIEEESKNTIMSILYIVGRKVKDTWFGRCLEHMDSM